MTSDNNYLGFLGHAVGLYLAVELPGVQLLQQVAPLRVCLPAAAAGLLPPLRRHRRPAHAAPRHHPLGGGLHGAAAALAGVGGVLVHQGAVVLPVSHGLYSTLLA